MRKEPPWMRTSERTGAFVKKLLVLFAAIPRGGNTDECPKRGPGRLRTKQQLKLKEKEKESGGPGSHVPGFQCRNGGAPLLAGVLRECPPLQYPGQCPHITSLTGFFQSQGGTWG